MSITPKIGVLALQGDFDAHRRRLQELGASVVLVKKPEQLDEIDGLVIPGGESATFLKLLGPSGFEKLKHFFRLKPTFCTCARSSILDWPVWGRSIFASAAMLTDARSTARSGKASCYVIWMANSMILPWRWFSSEPRKFRKLAKELK